MSTDLNDVLVFTRVVDERSFTAAARALGLPKSTVSRRVSRLEDRLGVRLLQRTTRKLSLTEAGSAYYERSARIVADLDEADRAVTGLQETPSGRLRVTTPVEMGDRMMGLVSEFLSRYPEVSLEVDLTGRYVDLVEESYDLALRAGVLPDSSLVARKLAEAPHRLVASPTYLERKGVPETVEALRDHACIVHASSPANAVWTLRGPRGTVRVPVSGRLAANHFAMVKGAALAGLGIAKMPRSMCEAELSTGALAEILPGVCPVAGAMWAVYPHSRHLSPKVRAFVDFLAEQLGERNVI